MEFKIPVDDAQLIVNKLSNVAKLGSDDVDGLVLIEADENVNFYVNDKSISLRMTSRDSEVISTGKILCRLNDFKGYLGKFTKLTDDFGTEFFTFLLKDDVLLIKTKTIFRDSKPSYKKLVVPLLDVSIYPKVKYVDDTQLIVNSSILKEGISSVLHCVNVKETRPSLKGVAISVKSDKLVFAATNGVKLSEAVLDINTDSIAESTYVFKYDFASALKYLLDPDSQVFVTFEGSNAYIKCNDMYIVGSTIINEGFPNYKKAFDMYKHTMIIPRLSLYDSVANAIDVLDVDDNSRLSIKFEGNKMLLKNERVEIEQEFEEEFEQSLDIDVNGAFLNDLLANFGGDVLRLYFSDSNSPIIIRSGVDDDRTVLLTNLRRR